MDSNTPSTLNPAQLAAAGNAAIDYSSISPPVDLKPSDWEPPRHVYYGPKDPATGRMRPEPVYAHQEYPRMVYSRPDPDGPIKAMIVDSAQERAQLGDGWTNNPGDHGYIGCPSQEQIQELRRIADAAALKRKKLEKEAAAADAEALREGFAELKRQREEFNAMIAAFRTGMGMAPPPRAPYVDVPNAPTAAAPLVPSPGVEVRASDVLGAAPMSFEPLQPSSTPAGTGWVAPETVTPDFRMPPSAQPLTQPIPKSAPIVTPGDIRYDDGKDAFYDLSGNEVPAEQVEMVTAGEDMVSSTYRRK